ncbi:MAG: helix-turn-helix transcriptional regulator, partial [Lachnospiraceae bacterium]|nr:helix-turn-helix transcriptional regulator [Lachnospiraceae bacterium]
MDLGSRILEQRQGKGMTQEELAVRIGVTPQALSKWERNQSLPDTALLADLCRVLGVSADYLLSTERQKITENEDSQAEDIIRKKLRNCCEPLIL